MSLRHAILGLLDERPAHGYQISCELEQRLGGGPYNTAQVYQALRWLADHALVVAGALERGSSRDRRPFSITSGGRAEFAKWLLQPLIPFRPTRDDAVLKIVFVGARDPVRLLELLERLRHAHLRRLAAAGRSSRNGSPVGEGELLRSFAATALRFREEAEIKWIDHVLLKLQANRPEEGPREREALVSPTAQVRVRGPNGVESRSLRARVPRSPSG